mmetsp:Transcript_826/g.1820  ORF Transcript_826/g.1820 Transcript_826/m.1820 type:complete len:226 (+) Transcript_826:188-865(+)
MMDLTTPPSFLSAPPALCPTRPTSGLVCTVMVARTSAASSWLRPGSVLVTAMRYPGPSLYCSGHLSRYNVLSEVMAFRCSTCLMSSTALSFIQRSSTFIRPARGAKSPILFDAKSSVSSSTSLHMSWGTLESALCDRYSSCRPVLANTDASHSSRRLLCRVSVVNLGRTGNAMDVILFLPRCSSSSCCNCDTPSITRIRLLPSSRSFKPTKLSSPSILVILLLDR